MRASREAFTSSQLLIILGEKMNENDLYEAIFKRKSIRNYDPAQLDQNHLEDISKNLDALKPMSTGIKTEFKIISPDQVTRKGITKHPTT